MAKMYGQPQEMKSATCDLQYIIHECELEITGESKAANKMPDLQFAITNNGNDLNAIQNRRSQEQCSANAGAGSNPAK